MVDGRSIAEAAVSPLPILEAEKWRSEHCQERREGEGAADLDKRNAAVKFRGSDWQRKQEPMSGANLTKASPSGSV